MPFKDLEQLRDALRAFIVEDGGKKRFEMPPDGVGSGPVAALITASFQLTDGKWVLTDPTEPTITGDAVEFEGTAPSLLGFGDARLGLFFDLLDAGRPSLLVEVAPGRQPVPIPGWNLGNSIPLWAELRSPLADLAFEAPAFYYSSIPRAPKGPRPALTTGLNFTAAQLRLSGIIGLLTSFPGLSLERLTGPITGPPTAPHMKLDAAAITPIPVAYLDLPLVFSALSTDYRSFGKEQVPPPTISTYLQFASSIPIGNKSIPIEMIFGGVGPIVVFSAQLGGLQEYALEEFSKLVRDAPIGSYLDRYFQVPDVVGLKGLDVMVSTEPFGLAAVRLGLGTKRSITVVPGWVEIPDVHIDFMVNDPAGTRDITAVLGGTFRFLDGIDVNVTASYPQMVFAGSAVTDPPIPLARIVQKFVPSVQTFPAISLNRLYATADLKSKRYAFQIGVESDWKIPIGIAKFSMEDAALALGYDATAATKWSGEISAVAVLFTNDDTEIARFYADWKLPGANFLVEGTFPEIPLSDLATTLTGGGVPNSVGLPKIVLRESKVSFRMAQGANREMRLTGTSSYRFSLETTIDVEKIGQAHLFFEVRRGSAPSPAERLGIPPRPARKALAPPRPDGMALDAMGVVAIPDATDESSGFVAGLVLEPDWKPDSLWSGLSGVFDQFTVRDAGLILSSIEDDNFALPELPMGYVPSKIEPGITFFSALELSGKVFEPLRHLFASTGELDLYAHIDTRSLANSEIVALLPGDDGHKDISFTGLEIGMKPGKGEFTIKAGARFTLWSEHLTLEGSGAIVLGTTPTIAFTIRIADWEEPFGIAGLVVESFGLSFGVDPGGVLIGLDGQFLIGSDPATQFRFGIGGAVYDFEAPSAIEFTLESGSKRPLKVTDLVEQFVPSLDLSAVPLLNGIAFVKLDFYVVANPGGWIIAGKKFPQGVGIDADLLLYDWELKLLLQVSKEDGILADGELNKPIYVLDVLTISNAAGDKGPSLKIDTTGLMPAAPTPMQRVDEQRRRRELAAIEGVEPAATGINPYTVLTVGDPSKVYFAASGAVKVLGLTERFSGSITSDGFEVNFHADLDKLFRADVMAAFSKSSGFEGHASGNFDFRLSFPDGVSIDGWPLLPPCEIVGPYASLAFDLVLKTTEAYVAFDLDFNWGEFHFHPKFRLDAKDIPRMLEDLWTHIVDWIEGNLRTFFAAVLADVTAYLKALEDGFLWAGQGAVEIAKTLYHLFDVTGIEELAADLVRIGRLQFSGMVDALIALFDISYAAAVAVLRKIGEQCAVASNEAVLYSSNPERL